MTRLAIAAALLLLAACAPTLTPAEEGAAQRVEVMLAATPDAGPCRSMTTTGGEGRCAVHPYAGPEARARVDVAMTGLRAEPLGAWSEDPAGGWRRAYRLVGGEGVTVLVRAGTVWTLPR